jgi:hypothetical protein
VPIYPPLFAAYPILALFAQNAGEVRSLELVSLLAAAVAVAAAVWLVLGLMLRSAAKGALVAAAAVVFFYSFDRLIPPLESLLTDLSQLWVGKQQLAVDPLWVLLPELAMLAGFAVLVGRLGDLPRTTRFLNLLAVIALAMPLARIATVKAPVAARPARQARPMATAPPAEVPRRPDIYYIILDGYARHDVMASHFGFDNAAFLDHLRDKGFYVASRSTSNYGQTPLSLSSSLNASYLDELVKGLSTDQTELSDLIGRNDVVATLKPHGYSFVTFATGFQPTEHPEADRYLSPRAHLSEFQRMVVDLTPAQVIWPDPSRLDPFQQLRERILYLLDHVPEVARDPTPTFTFAHILCPHPPIIFGPEGQDIGREHEQFKLFREDKVKGRFLRPEFFRRAYRDQAAYITARAQEMVDRILAESPEPPIIIVQSDHGSELNLDMESVENTDLPERMSILNAYYFPDRRYKGLYPTISPVNSFRVVFNTFFGARLSLLPDRSYFSTWPDPYRFIDVTDAVRTEDADD